MKVDVETAERAQVSVEASEGFVLTEAVRELADRAVAYLRAGYPVHLCGPTGTGKTTLAFHVAAMLKRPIVLLHGDHQLTSADLIGSPSGTRTSRVVDNYIRSVVRTEEERRDLWVDNRLTTACRYGHTLIYDEFNRTTAEANNPLLSVFSERILNLPKASDGRESYIRVHPHFAAVLTSNPEEYAGVYRAPDALLDRVITIHLDFYDATTETSIVAARASVPLELATRIVAMVRGVRSHGRSRARPTIRAAITIARVMAASGLELDRPNAVLRAICTDVLGTDPFTQTLDLTSELPVATVLLPAEVTDPVKVGDDTATSAHAPEVVADAPESDAPESDAPESAAPESDAPESATLESATPVRRKRNQAANVGWLHALEESNKRV